MVKSRSAVSSARRPSLWAKPCTRSARPSVSRVSVTARSSRSVKSESFFTANRPAASPSSAFISRW